MSDNLLFYLSLSPDNIANETEKLINTSLKNHKRLLEIDISSDTGKFIDILANEVTEFNGFHTICSFLQFVSPNKDVRKYSYNSDNILTQHAEQLNMRKDIYNKISEYYCTKELNNESDRFIRRVLDRYVHNGVNVDERYKETLLKVNQEIKKIEKSVFLEMYKESSKHMEFTEGELYGLPEECINRLTVVSNNPTKYAVLMNDSNYMMCMKYIKNADVRRVVEHIYGTRCSNVVEIVLKLLVLKHKRAKLLSYDSHGDYVSATNSVSDTESVKNTLIDVLKKIEYRYTNEINTLSKIKQKDTGVSEINSWDLDYYVTLWKKEYGVNEHTVRQYFPTEHVVNKILEIYEELFSLKFDKVKDHKSWHPDTSLYKVTDNSTNSVIGYFYTDLYKRTGKSTYTRFYGLQNRCNYPHGSSSYQPGVAVIIASFDKNNSTISFPDIVNFFREFCYVVHHLSGVTKYCVFSGINIESDFIDTFPTVLENMCWEKKIIKKLSQEQIPEHIVDKMIKIRDISIGIHYKKHILVSLYDQILNSSTSFIKEVEKVLKIKNSEDRNNSIFHTMFELYRILYEQVNGTNSVVMNDNVFIPTSWINFVGSGGAKYYSYILNRIYASDIYYTKFLNRTEYDRTGVEFRDSMFTNNTSSVISLKNYLGRPVSIDSFLKMYKLNVDTDMSYFMSTDKIKLDKDEDELINMSSPDLCSDSEYSNRFTEASVTTTDSKHRIFYKKSALF